MNVIKSHLQLQRLETIAKNHGLTTDELVNDLETGKLRLVKCELYSVMLTEGACEWLQSRGINCFVRGKNCFATSEDDAITQFQQEFPVAIFDPKLMLNVSKV